ncbi:MAG: hypothetical protein KJ587_01020 [Alphaproteobacteria bacterium]|nr:hypothetical protein [Alphaproteobacteria bacterium]
MWSFRAHQGFGTNGRSAQSTGATGLRAPARLTRWAALFAAVMIGPLLAACGDSGFRPVHADLGGVTPTSQKLASLSIAPIPGRVGQQLRNELIFQANGGADPLTPEYRLDIAIREGITSTLVRQTGDARGQVYNLDAKFKVTRLSDKKVVLSGTSFGRAGFERFDSIYSNVRARRDAEDRAAKTVAVDMKARLAAFLAASA